MTAGCLIVLEKENKTCLAELDRGEGVIMKRKVNVANMKTACRDQEALMLNSYDIEVSGETACHI